MRIVSLARINKKTKKETSNLSGERSILNDWLKKGKKWARWGISRGDYFSIGRVLNLDAQGEIKLCVKCKKRLKDRLEGLQKAPLRLCKFCDTVLEIEEVICPNCKRAQN